MMDINIKRCSKKRVFCQRRIMYPSKSTQMVFQFLSHEVFPFDQSIFKLMSYHQLRGTVYYKIVIIITYIWLDLLVLGLMFWYMYNMSLTQLHIVFERDF